MLKAAGNWVSDSENLARKSAAFLRTDEPPNQAIRDAGVE
jgi:hypothetical protein